LSWGFYSEGEFFTLRSHLSILLASGSGIFLLIYFSKTGKFFYKTIYRERPLILDEERIDAKDIFLVSAATSTIALLWLYPSSHYAHPYVNIYKF